MSPQSSDTTSPGTNSESLPIGSVLHVRKPSLSTLFGEATNGRDVFRIEGILQKTTGT